VNHPAPDETLDAVDGKILNLIQRNFPLVPRPFAEIARHAGIDEAEAIERISRMRASGSIRRVRALYDATKLGYVSALVACRVDPDRLEAVARHLNALTEVSHNYLRAHAYNLWFTLIARDPERREKLLGAIRALEGVRELHLLPATRTFKLQVDFKMEEGA
jgi:DNA-binding Lrp family transcriptional regulator